MNANLRWLSSIAAAVCISGGAWAADEGVELKSEIDKTSYALGYQIGGDFQRQKIDLNAAAVLKGIADARSSTAPLMTEQAMRETLIELKRKVVAQERAHAVPQIDKGIDRGIDGGTGKGTGPAAAPGAKPAPNEVAPTPGSAPSPGAGNMRARRAAARTTPGAKAFMEKNAKREGIVTLPSGLQYKVIKEGKGKQPQASDKVALIYRGSFVNGNEFGNTKQDGKPAPKLFSVSSLVPGMREAVSRMKEGAQWQVYVPPEIGFDATTPLYRKVTVFDVQLVAVNP